VKIAYPKHFKTKELLERQITIESKSKFDVDESVQSPVVNNLRSSHDILQKECPATS